MGYKEKEIKKWEEDIEDDIENEVRNLEWLVFEMETAWKDRFDSESQIEHPKHLAILTLIEILKED